MSLEKEFSDNYRVSFNREVTFSRRRDVGKRGQEGREPTFGPLFFPCDEPQSLDSRSRLTW